jgi:tetratricopeptide (TPR) repeat protein
VADFYAVLKPMNQARRVYSLDDVSPRPEENLEIEDLLQIRALEVATRLDPNGVFYQNRLGELAWSLGLKSLAQGRYREAVTLWPEQTKHLFLARLDVEPEMVQATVEGMERAVRPPRRAEPERVYRNLGIFLMEHGRPAEAREAFQKAEQSSHGRSYAVWQAAAEAGAGNLDEAIRLYRRSLTAGEVSSDQRFQAQWNLGALLERQGHHREAAQELTNALALRPRDTRALLALGRVYESLGLREDAEEQYVRASEAGGDRVELLVNLVEFYRRIGRPTDALDPARKLVELVPDEPLYRRQVGELEAQIQGAGP